MWKWGISPVDIPRWNRTYKTKRVEDSGPRWDCGELHPGVSITNCIFPPDCRSHTTWAKLLPASGPATGCTV